MHQRSFYSTDLCRICTLPEQPSKILPAQPTLTLTAQHQAYALGMALPCPIFIPMRPLRLGAPSNLLFQVGGHEAQPVVLGNLRLEVGDVFRLT